MALTGGDSGTTATKKKTADQIAAALGGYRQPNTTTTVNAAATMPKPGSFGQIAGGGTSTPGAGQDPFQTNPGYLAALANEQAGSQQADAALRAAQEAAIVGYGDPSLAAALGFSVDDNTAAAARANYLSGNSSLARLDRQKGLNEQGNVNNLAAHGILFSGELGYQAGQIGRNYGNAVYDTQQQLLAGLNAARGQDLATKQGLRGQTVDALNNAYNLFVQNPGFYGADTKGKTGTPPPPPPPSGGGLPNQGSGPYIGTKSRLARTPLPNPYTTGQKRFG